MAKEAKQPQVSEAASPATTAETAPATPQKPPPTANQRIIEHGLSFGILAPAIGGFIVFLLTFVSYVPADGVGPALAKALGYSGHFFIAGYMVGIFPSLITGLLAYPLWRQFGGGWELYLICALVNCTLCGLTTYLLLGTSALGTLLLGAVGGIATLGAVAMTRRLRQEPAATAPDV